MTLSVVSVVGSSSMGQDSATCLRKETSSQNLIRSIVNQRFRSQMALQILAILTPQMNGQD